MIEFMIELTASDLISKLRAQYGSLASAAKELKISTGSLYALSRKAKGVTAKDGSNTFAIMCKVADKLGIQYAIEQRIFLLTKTI